MKESTRIKKVNSIKSSKIHPESKANNNIYNNESKTLMGKKPNKTEAQNKKNNELKAKNLNKKNKKKEMKSNNNSRNNKAASKLKGKEEEHRQQQYDKSK